MLGYDKSGALMAGNNWQVYPTSDLLPQQYLGGAVRKTLIFLPLFYHDRHFGFIALSSGGSDDLVYETVRERISATLRNIQLFRREKKAEKKLRSALDILQKSEDRYKEMAVLLPSVIIETDRDFLLTFINQSGRESFGLSDIDLSRGVRLDSLSHEDDRARLLEFRALALRGIGGAGDEIRLVKSDDSATVLLGRMQPVLQDGKISGFRWGVMDLKPFAPKGPRADDELFKKYRFSPRENEVLTFILKGTKIRDIAEELFVAESTVKGHITSIYSKIGVKNRMELFELIKDHQMKDSGYESFLYAMLIKLFQN
jgi:DNA-binding CsgD family transcriptional regulator/PAS domain-containing protein